MLSCVLLLFLLFLGLIHLMNMMSVEYRFLMPQFSDVETHSQLELCGV